MKVYAMTLKADFYVLAESESDALDEASRICSLTDLEDIMPTDAEPSYSAYEIRAQDDYHRRLCVNYPPQDREGET
jgi:hypothetical protein